MKTFQEFMSICEEVEDKSKALGFAATIRRSRPGGRIGAERKKTEPEKRRMKAAGGGKMVPAKPYKPRSDIGSQRQTSTRVQQPEQERGSARERQLAAAKEERRKAAQARAAAKKGGKPAPEKKPTPTASQLLAKKKKATVSPDYKPQKASGMARAERDKLRGEGERYLASIMKKQETEKYKQETGKEPDKKGKMLIGGRVKKRMST